MSFNFGSNTQGPFGSTPVKPAGFGAPLSFGSAPANTVAPSPFGGQQAQGGPTPFSAFGTPKPSASAFGATPAFGAVQQNTGAPAQPAFGSGFGTAGTGAFGQQSAAAPTGLSFGAFGSQQGVGAAPAFGAGFGAAKPIGAATGTPGSSLFGAPSFNFSTQASAPKPSGFFGSPANTGLFSTSGTTPSLFSTSTSGGIGGGLFGSTATTTTTPSLFGSSFGNTGTMGGVLFGSTGNTGLFGSTATSTAPLFSSGAPFGTTSTFGTGKPLFGGGFGSTGGGLFGQPQQQQQQQQQQQMMQQQQQPVIDTQEARNRQILSSFYAINIFNDERDEIMKKWNLLQASWGTGKGYYNTSQPPVDYNDANPYYVFRGIGYFMVPTADNSEGLVKLIFNRKESELSSQREVLSNGMAGILGNKPNLAVQIKCIKGISDTETEVTISVTEKSITGANKIISASDLAAYLNQPAQRNQLGGVGVSCVTPCMTPTKTQMQEYLKLPPQGIDVHTWHAAQADNPQPSKFLPMPMNGFSSLKKRMITENYETNLHRSFLEKVNEQIMDLQRKHAATQAQIAEQKQKYLQLQHRVLQILVKQEVTRKVGTALQPEEEVLRGRLEMMNAHLNQPSQYRGQISELASSVRFTSVAVDNNRIEAAYKLDPKVEDDVKQFIKMQQNGIEHLVQIINTDLKDLKTVFEGMNQIINK